jgi:hypothetical protein
MSKNRKAEKEPRPQKKVHSQIHFQEDTPRNPLFFSNRVQKLMDIFLMLCPTTGPQAGK